MAGFFAGEPASTASLAVSGFFRLIKWLMSLGFASAENADDDDAAPAAVAADDDDEDDGPVPLLVDDCGVGFMNNAI